MPSEVVVAAAEFITGTLLENPRRPGKRLREALTGIHSARLGREWQILYEIDEAMHTVIILDIRHPSNAYGAR